jgi:hypothetical protein
MSEFIFTKPNPSQIISEIITEYERLSNKTLYPADVERIFVDILAYMEQGVYAKIELATRQNFVQFASGIALDYHGEFLGVDRELNENDETFRSRILNENRFISLGTRNFYAYKIKSLVFVSDVKFFTKQEISSLPPGLIQVCVLTKNSTSSGNNYGSEIISAIQQNEILQVVNDHKNNLIGDWFEFVSAEPLSINGSIKVRKKIGIDAIQLKSSLESIVENYFNSLSLNFDANFAGNDLQRLIVGDTNVLDIMSFEFLNLPIKQTKNFVKKGNINIEVL